MKDEEKVDTVVSKEKEVKKIDLDSLKIVNKNSLEQDKDLSKALYSSNIAFEIVAPQSAYSAKLKPLVHKDTVSLLYSDLSRFEYKKEVFKTIYNKISETSVGVVNFDEWLRMTTVEDLETFMYGLYCITFPNDGEFTYTCPRCGSEHSFKINSKSLITTIDKKELRDRMKSISKIVHSKKDMEKLSLVGKQEGILLPDSNIVVVVKTPSLKDSLNLLGSIREDFIDKNQNSVTNMLYIDKILVPSVNANNETEYSEMVLKESILRTLDELTLDDSALLTKSINERVIENRITYSVKNVKCPDCDLVIEEYPISIEDMLFTMIFDKTR